jgi:hypothetical protein
MIYLTNCNMFSQWYTWQIVTCSRHDIPDKQVYHGENKLQFVRYIMARTSYNLSGISWREQVTICQVYHGENKLQFVRYIMARTSYNYNWQIVTCSRHDLPDKLYLVLAMIYLTNCNLFSPWYTWQNVTCSRHDNKFQFVRYIMARTSYNLSGISWREQATICQVYHGESKLLFVRYIMAGTSYNLSGISSPWYTWQIVTCSRHDLPDKL